MEAQVRSVSHSAQPWSPSPDAAEIVQRIHAMLHPRNIVLVGATDKPGNYAERIWNNLVKYKYEGGLYPVNSKRETIWGVPCYKDFASLPEKPDHVLVLVPARFAVQVIRDAAAAGARSATIVTSGFSELQDAESQRLAVELKQAIQVHFAVIFKFKLSAGSLIVRNYFDLCSELAAELCHLLPLAMPLEV